LIGTLSEHIGRLTGLTTLDISYNQLQGSLPEFLGKLSSLTLLDLSDNKLNGTLRDIFRSCVALEQMDLSSNQLSGIIPSGLFELKSVNDIALNTKVESQTTGIMRRIYRLCICTTTD